MCLPLEAVEPKLSETKIQVEKYYYEKYVLYCIVSRRLVDTQKSHSTYKILREIPNEILCASNTL